LGALTHTKLKSSCRSFDSGRCGDLRSGWQLWLGNTQT
jgi:hypothetical protein